MIDAIVYVIISLSSDFRVHAHGGYFVDVREGRRNGRQMTTRNPATLAEAHRFVDQLREAAPRSGKAIQFIVDDQATRWLTAENIRLAARSIHST